MKSKEKSSGFTIVELMLGMLGMAIIALVVGAMLVYGWIGWRRNMESVAMQRNAMIAIRMIEHRVRNDAVGQIGGSGTQVLTFSTGETDFSANEFSSGSFVSLNSFSAMTNEAGWVDIAFTLSTVSRTDEDRYQMTIFPRN